MKGKLAVHGGPRTVPPGLKRRWPEITQEDKEAVLAVLDRGILTGVHGPEAKALERKWAEFCGSRYALRDFEPQRNDGPLGDECR